MNSNPTLSCQPGWRRLDTAQPAMAGGLRRRVFEELRRAPGSCEDVAERLGAGLLSVRPRCSELAGQSRITDSGRRGLSANGRKVIIWRAVER